MTISNSVDSSSPEFGTNAWLQEKEWCRCKKCLGRQMRKIYEVRKRLDRYGLMEDQTVSFILLSLSFGYFTLKT